jgi:hypothetical protein
VDELTERELTALDIEARLFTKPGARHQAVADRLGLGWAQYGQMLNALLDKPAALAHDPVLVNRLRRRREAARASRTHGGLGTVGA